MSYFQKGKLYKYVPQNWPGRWSVPPAPKPETTEVDIYMTEGYCETKQYEIKVPVMEGDVLMIHGVMTSLDGSRMVYGLHKKFAGWMRLSPEEWVRVRT